MRKTERARQENESTAVGKHHAWSGKTHDTYREKLRLAWGKQERNAGKMESGSWESEDGKAKKCGLCFLSFSTFGPRWSSPRSRRRNARKPEQRKQVQGRSEVKRNGERSGP
jgi:hypothetical protein